MIFILSLAFSYTIHTALHEYVLKYSTATIEIEVPSSQEVKYFPGNLDLGHSYNTKPKFLQVFYQC